MKFLHVYIFPVMVQVIFPLLSRFGQYLHFFCLQAFLMVFEIVPISLRETPEVNVSCKYHECVFGIANLFMILRMKTDELGCTAQWITFLLCFKMLLVY